MEGHTGSGSAEGAMCAFSGAAAYTVGTPGHEAAAQGWKRIAGALLQQEFLERRQQNARPLRIEIGIRSALVAELLTVARRG
jgi:hypothetical protein